MASSEVARFHHFAVAIVCYQAMVELDGPPINMSEDKQEQKQHDDNSIPDMPWCWIKCVRDLTDPGKNPLATNDNSNLPVEICSWLLLSDRKSAMNMTKMKECRVTHILSVHAVPPVEEQYYQERLAGTNIIHKRIHCDDTEGYDMIGKHWKECYDFLKNVRDQLGKRVVVHCVAGVNRSGLVACAAYMILEQETLISTVQHVVKCRGTVLWNRSFQRQLCLLAQREGLLGPKPKDYSDAPLVDDAPALAPAHEILGIAQAKFRLSSHLAALHIRNHIANQTKKE